MINRRKVFAILAAFPFVAKALLSQPSKRVSVTTLEHGSFEQSSLAYISQETHYKERWTFDTEEQALEFVRSLIPNVYKVEVYVPGQSVIRSGYRKAVTAAFEGHEDKFFWQIINRDTMEPVVCSDFPIWDFGRAWSVLENIRIDGKPVSRNGYKGQSRICEYLSQPILKDNCKVVNLEREL